VGLAVGTGIEEASTIMLVPTTRDVALSVAVAVRDTIGDGLLVGDGLTGMMMEADWLRSGEGVGEGVSEAGTGVETAGADAAELVPADAVGNSLWVRLVEVGGSSVGMALLGAAVDNPDDTSSEAGTLKDWLLTGVAVGAAEVPTDPLPDGVIPEAVGEGETLAVGTETVEERTSEAGTPDERTSEVGTPEDVTTPEDGLGTTPVGTEPDEGNTPDDGRVPVGTTPDDGSTPEDGRISDSTLEIGRGGRMTGSLVGMPDADREETIVGRKLASPTVGVGAVTPAPVPEGVMPGTSDGTCELRGTSDNAELVAAASEVGIGPELKGSVGVGEADPWVPRAVVIPMTMPEDASPEGETGELVGRTTMSGIPPVEPTSGVGVGRTMMSGIPPVEPTSGLGVGRIIISGRPPVEPAAGVLVGMMTISEALAAELAAEVGVGRTTVSGIPPVEPRMGLLVGRTTISGMPPVEPRRGLLVGSTTISGMPPVEPRRGLLVGRTTMSGMPPVEPRMGPLVGRTTMSGIPPVEPSLGLGVVGVG
jgi:hypothetical protein